MILTPQQERLRTGCVVGDKEHTHLNWEGALAVRNSSTKYGRGRMYLARIYSPHLTAPTGHSVIHCQAQH
jgi:hypothetical protein